MMGSSLFNLKKFREAIQTYSKIEKNYPTSNLVPTSIYQIAASHFNLGEYDEARQRYQRFLTLYPEDRNAPNAQLFIGWIYFKQTEWEQAKEALQKVILNYPQEEQLHPDAYSLIGECNYNQEKYGEALNTFEILIGKYPNSNFVPHAWLRIGECYEQMNQAEKSLEVFR
ncbi:unnamed protein product, partial [marine sediment metagenome]